MTSGDPSESDHCSCSDTHAAMKLKLMAKERGVHPVVSVSNIHHYTPEEIPECPEDPCLGPDVIDGKEEYEVEKVLDSKYCQGQLVYLVKYKGWPNSNNKWLPQRT